MKPGGAAFLFPDNEEELVEGMLASFVWFVDGRNGKGGAVRWRTFSREVWLFGRWCSHIQPTSDKILYHRILSSGQPWGLVAMSHSQAKYQFLFHFLRD